MKQVLSFVTGLFVVLLLGQPVLACTGVYVGKDLTEDGSTIFGRTEDLEMDHNKNLKVVEAKENKEGDILEDPSNGFQYPLPKESFKYTSLPDTTPEYGEYAEAGYNEYGVMMDATVSSYPSEDILAVDPLVEDGLAESAMTSLILPHVKTAREGIEMLAKVIDEKGAAEGNTLIIADQDETWYMEIVSGHQYAAMKLPADKYAVFPNSYFMGAVDPEDTENVITSDKLIETADQAGTLKEEEGLIKVAASYAADIDEGTISRYWAGVNALNPSEEVTLDQEEFPFLHDSQGKISIEDIMAFQRNRFEGTDYLPSDTRASAAGGEAEGNTDEEEKTLYPIGNQNTMEAHIFQVKEDMPKEVPGLMWLSMGSPLVSPYLPVFANITDSFEGMQVTSNEYDDTSYYWAVNKLMQTMLADEDQLKDPIRQEVLSFEDAYVSDMDSFLMEIKDTFQSDKEEAAKLSTDKTLQLSKEAFDLVKKLEKEYVKE